MTNTQIRAPNMKHKTLHPGSSLYDLPGEIRNMIWKALIPSDRIINAKIRNAWNKDYDYKPPLLEVIYFPISNPIPLHICQESRSYAMGAYRFGFDEEQNKDGKIVCNPDTDILFIHFSNDFYRYITFKFQITHNKGVFNKVRHLALNFTKRLQSRILEPSYGMELLTGFKSLKTLTLVLSFDQQEHTGTSNPKVNALYEASHRADVIICHCRFAARITYKYLPGNIATDEGIRLSAFLNLLNLSAKEYKELNREWNIPKFQIKTSKPNLSRPSDWCLDSSCIYSRTFK